MTHANPFSLPNAANAFSKPFRKPSTDVDTHRQIAPTTNRLSGTTIGDFRLQIQDLLHRDVSGTNLSTHVLAIVMTSPSPVVYMYRGIEFYIRV
jgi:hypothetical protein